MVTKVYRVSRADGREVFKAVWHVEGVRTMRSFSTYAAAHAEASMKAEQLAAGVSPGGLRVSLGIEHIDDIKADIVQALGA